jgi:transposase-like protein
MSPRTLKNWNDYGFTENDDDKVRIRKFSDDERAAAVKLCKEIGVLSAAKQLSIGGATLYKWVAIDKAQKADRDDDAQPASSLEKDDAPVEDRPADNCDALKKSIDTLAANVDALTAAISYLMAELSKPRNCLFNLGGDK